MDPRSKRANNNNLSLMKIDIMRLIFKVLACLFFSAVIQAIMIQGWRYFMQWYWQYPAHPFLPAVYFGVKDSWPIFVGTITLWVGVGLLKSNWKACIFSYFVVLFTLMVKRYLIMMDSQFFWLDFSLVISMMVMSFISCLLIFLSFKINGLLKT